MNQTMRVHILGVPHDENSSFLKGASEAPPKIRSELFSYAYNMWTETGMNLGTPGLLDDAGDLLFNEAIDAWELIESSVFELIRDGNGAICLGGDHAITHPVARAFSKKYPDLGILHFDAHPDIYQDFEGNPRSHASPFARIMEEQLASRLVQVGIRTATGHQRDQWKRYGVEAIEMRQLESGASIVFETPVYISLDIDAIDPAYAPGVSHREPGGMSPRQIIDTIHSLDGQIVGADIVEYNPRRDLSDVTATVAAKLLKEIAGRMLGGPRLGSAQK
jgi:agmatinase